MFRVVFFFHLGGRSSLVSLGFRTTVEAFFLGIKFLWYVCWTIFAVRVVKGQRIRWQTNKFSGPRQGTLLVRTFFLGGRGLSKGGGGGISPPYFSAFWGYSRSPSPNKAASRYMAACLNKAV